jgi:hypothetical protein
MDDRPDKKFFHMQTKKQIHVLSLIELSKSGYIKTFEKEEQNKFAMKIERNVSF